MSTNPAPVSTGLAGQPVHTRITSIDIFRGLTMAVMIFVNDLGSVHGLSKWTYHFPANVNAMSYVDMVYPFFLFAVGLSMPLAVAQRLRRDPSLPRLWLHILLRAVALVVLGLILANVSEGNAALMHFSPRVWAMLALLGAILLWAVYPKTVARNTTLIIRGAGLLLLVAMLALFRRTADNGQVAWIDFSYPEILGLIGLTYFAVSLLYVPLRRFRYAPLACFALLLLFNIACVARWTTIDRLPMYILPFNNGAMPALIMAGVVISRLFLGEHAAPAFPRKLALATVFALVTAILGWLLVPLGISKIRATPTWTLWSVAAATVVFAFLYWLCDRRQHTGWAWLVRSAGSNTLLTYLLPDLFYFLTVSLGIYHFLGHWNAGLPGILRAVCFTVGILLLSLGLTRAKVRLQL